MLLIDLNQIVLSNLMMQIGSGKIKLEENLIRHMVLNTLRMYTKKFKHDYGNIVICCDSKHYWRRDYFPYYKANRKKDREKSKLDWTVIFHTMDNLRSEFSEYFPYKVINVEGTEADDVIAVLCKKYSNVEPILILSSDKDFTQLQKYTNVKQYSPIAKSFLKSDNPQKYIREHILLGDRGDGIPNFISPDNTFVIGVRQKVINRKRLESWIHQEPESFCDDNMLRGYKRNQMLVDFDYIPMNIIEKIVKAYDDAIPASKTKMLNYFIEKRLKSLIETIDEF